MGRKANNSTYKIWKSGNSQLSADSAAHLPTLRHAAITWQQPQKAAPIWGFLGGEGVGSNTPELAGLKLLTMPAIQEM